MSGDQVVLGLLAQKFGLEVLLSQPLEDTHDGCQPVRLGRSPGYLSVQGEFIVGGVSSPSQHPGTSSNLAFSIAFNHPAGGSHHLNEIKQPPCSGIHQLSGRNQKSCHGKNCRSDPVLGRTSCFSLVSNVQTWTIDKQTSLARRIWTQGYGPYTQRCSMAYDRIGDARCGPPGLQVLQLF